MRLRAHKAQGAECRQDVVARRPAASRHAAPTSERQCGSRMRRGTGPRWDAVPGHGVRADHKRSSLRYGVSGADDGPHSTLNKGLRKCRTSRHGRSPLIPGLIRRRGQRRVIALRLIRSVFVRTMEDEHDQHGRQRQRGHQQEGVLERSECTDHPTGDRRS
jgi:hypothetical protein